MAATNGDIDPASEFQVPKWYVYARCMKHKMLKRSCNNKATSEQYLVEAGTFHRPGMDAVSYAQRRQSLVCKMLLAISVHY